MSETDLISREAAIDALKDRYYKYGRFAKLEELVWAIEKLPSTQPEQQWIPVTERLPEAGVEVWVTIKGHDVIRCEEGETIEQAVDRISKIRWVSRGYWSDEEHAWNDPSFGFPLMVQPIAWMPINRPEPWRGGQDETN